MAKKSQSQAKKQKHRINQGIKAPEVRLVNAEGDMEGVMPLRDALQKAQEAELDLVEMAPQAQPPVCKLMNYGKYLYQQSKQERLHKAKQKKVELKAIRVSMKIEDHDLNIKVERAQKFLEKGNKVKFDMVLRGREKGFVPKAFDRMKDILAKFPEDVKQDQPLKKTPQGITVTLSKIQK